jgi:hypothetical protein
MHTVKYKYNMLCTGKDGTVLSGICLSVLLSDDYLGYLLRERQP